MADVPEPETLEKADRLSLKYRRIDVLIDRVVKSNSRLRSIFIFIFKSNYKNSKKIEIKFLLIN